jgi:hypothetical protein
VEAVTWLHEWAAQAGLPIRTDVEHTHVRPWGAVLRGVTDQRHIYLKVCGPSQAFEPALTALLARFDSDAVMPELLAIHASQPWMLLGDGGLRLADAPSWERLDVWRSLLPRYARLQRRLQGHEADLLGVGVPDLRLERIAPVLDSLIDDEPGFHLDRPDPFAPTYARLRELHPQVRHMVDELGSLGIGPTIQHDDLHHNNILVRDGRAVVIDWGDACVSHPFLSLWIVRRAVPLEAGVEDAGGAVSSLIDRYLEVWGDVAPMRELRRAADLGAALGEVSRALSQYRIFALYPEVAPPERKQGSSSR